MPAWLTLSASMRWSLGKGSDAKAPAGPHGDFRQVASDSVAARYVPPISMSTRPSQRAFLSAAVAAAGPDVPVANVVMLHVAA
jgi:hypothetical protein